MSDRQVGAIERSVKACPECDRTQIRKRADSSRGHRADDGRNYRCTICLETFDEPVERWAKNPGPSAETILDRVTGGESDE